MKNSIRCFSGGGGSLPKHPLRELLRIEDLLVATVRWRNLSIDCSLLSDIHDLIRKESSYNGDLCSYHKGLLER